MRSLLFAARALVRQPGRALLGVMGIAGVGALLFDMLLLSNGLAVSFRHLLDRVGYDVRLTATDALAGAGPRLTKVDTLVPALTALPEIADAVPVRFIEADVVSTRSPIDVTLIGAPPARPSASRPWTILEGRDVEGDGIDHADLVVNRRLADRAHAAIGDTIQIRGSCSAERSAIPFVSFRVAGIAEFPFDDASTLTAAGTSDAVARACGDEGHAEADLILIRSRETAGPQAAIAAIRRVAPGLHAFSNEELVARVQDAGLSYFRQISTVLASVTLFFGFLLITVLLTVSVNQRLGELAALRALGFSRRRIAADVLWQSALLVGTGGALALPLGVLLSRGLDRILRAMPGVPSTLNFFEYQPEALILHVVLLATTAMLAAVYPARVVSNLPIAATLRNEVVS
jgi:putative ABC transport system permease protein